MAEELFDIDTIEYQKKAEHVMTLWLARANSQKNGFKEKRIRASFSQQPPHLRVLTYPDGGNEAALQRIRETFSGGTELSWGFFVPEAIATLHEHDLIHETIVATADNSEMLEFLQSEQIAPSHAKLLTEIKQQLPEHFVMIKRFFIGMEQDKHAQFSVAQISDPAWEKLELLATDNR